MDLSKAFDTINKTLVLAYGFFDQALSLLQSYLCNRFHRSIMNGSISSLNEVTTGAKRALIMLALLTKNCNAFVFLFFLFLVLLAFPFY